MKTLRLEKLTVQELRRLPEGKSMRVSLPEARAVYNGRALTYLQAPLIGCRFKVKPDYKNNQLTITKLPIAPTS